MVYPTASVALLSQDGCGEAEMGTVRWRLFRWGALVALWLLLAACASSSETETDSSSGADVTAAADGSDGSDGADGVGTAGTGGAGGGAQGSGGGGEDPDDGPGRLPSPLYIEAIQAFESPPSEFVANMEANCEEAKAGPTCIALTFEPAEKADDKSCSVDRTVPDVRYEKGKNERIAVGTKVTVYLECTEPSEEGSGDTTSGPDAPPSSSGADGQSAPGGSSAESSEPVDGEQR